MTSAILVVSDAAPGICEASGSLPWKEADAVGIEGHSLWRPCPENCPIRMHLPGESCEFTCVNGSLGSCTDMAMNVADVAKGICRSCEISGCQVCSPEDRCNECAVGFYLSKDGKACHSKYAFFAPCVYAILGVFLLTMASWYLWLRKQPIVNLRVLKRAVIRRHHMNLRDHTTQQHPWYPLSTNLCRARADGHIVGGRALLMFFSFQAFVISWTVFAACSWLMCAWVSKAPLLSEGKVSGVKEDIFSICNATLNELGGERQSTKVGKLAYTLALYFFTTLATFFYAVSQSRRRVRLDTDEATMKDFAVMLKGFPCETGSQVEQQRLSFVRKTTGCHPIGVSICWAYNAKEVTELIARETWLWGKVRDSCGDVRQANMPLQHNERRCGLMRSFFLFLTHLIAPPTQPEDADLGKARRHEERAVSAAANAQSTSFMYVVFRSETERDHAKRVFSCESEIPLYRGLAVQYEREGSGSEPENVPWQNFSNDAQGMRYRALTSVCAIAGAILLWGLLFYFPFAMYEAWSYSALGEPTDFTSETTFSMLVVAGNQILYLLCEKASQFIGFRFASQQLTAYIGLYTMALLSNLAIDLAILFYTTRIAMENVGLDVTRAAFLLGNDEMICFPVRARMGARLMSYNFPACFLLPFLCEALFTVIVPYHIYKKVVGTQPISQRAADAFLLPPLFEMGRYADVVLNMTQATISLCFSAGPQSFCCCLKATTNLQNSGGYVLPTLVGMFIGHTLVYAWDHYRVLRHVRKFRFTSFRTEKAAQRMLALPGASLLASAMLQLFQVGAVTPSTEAVAAIVMIGAAIAHIALHLLVLQYVVPWVGATEHTAATQTYEQVAKMNPGNWFNMNPIHCLRSRYVHQHDPPCIFYQIGKEHLLEPNAKLGLFYSAPEWKNEAPSTYLELARLARRSLARGTLADSGMLPQGARDEELQREQICAVPEEAVEDGSMAEAHRTGPQGQSAGSKAVEKPRKSVVTFASDEHDADQD
ncbi:unnamed protein product [Durusdinium trenchii]|uniref:Uncharacterized protein n=1 Tax=Durusdinium trenchii TaxID=1381693 RepID=A0ABP0PME3_9DINO